MKLILICYPGIILRIPIFTDNQGNAFSMLSGRAKKWPNSAILCELTMTLYRAEATISPAFVKREYNQWADDLTHMDFAGFDLSKRLSILDTMPWMTLEHLVSSVEHTSDAVGSDQ